MDSRSETDAIGVLSLLELSTAGSQSMPSRRSGPSTVSLVERYSSDLRYSETAGFQQSLSITTLQYLENVSPHLTCGSSRLGAPRPRPEDGMHDVTGMIRFPVLIDSLLQTHLANCVLLYRASSISSEVGPPNKYSDRGRCFAVE